MIALSSDTKHHRFQLFFGTFDAVVLMASIFILFPKDNAEYAPAALQHFQWAVERFETMSERNRLAAAAMRVLQAIHYRLEKALNTRSASPASLLLGMHRNESATLEGTGDSTSSDFQSQNHYNSNDKNKTASVSTTGESPSLNNNAGSGSGSVSTRGTSIFTTPGESGDGGPTPTGHFTAVGSGSAAIDPVLTGAGNAMTTTSDWSLPEDFDWGSIQPVYAMADVAYNDLMGFSSNSNNNHDGENHHVVGGSSTMSMPNWAGGTPLLNDVPPNDGTTAVAGEGGGGGGGGAGGGGGGGDSQGWLFGGDFGNDSVWSLLNQYPPPY